MTPRRKPIGWVFCPKVTPFNSLAMSTHLFLRIAFLAVFDGAFCGGRFVSSLPVFWPGRFFFAAVVRLANAPRLPLAALALRPRPPGRFGVRALGQNDGQVAVAFPIAEDAAHGLEADSLGGRGIIDEDRLDHQILGLQVGGPLKRQRIGRRRLERFGHVMRRDTRA